MFKSFLAIKYEALVLRELKHMSNPSLQVLYEEWISFAQESCNYGFYSIAIMVIIAHPYFKVFSRTKLFSSELLLSNGFFIVFLTIYYVMQPMLFQGFDNALLCIHSSNRNRNHQAPLKTEEIIKKIKKHRDMTLALTSPHSGTFM